MNRVVARVLYEDSRGPRTEFGLHKLVLACVADRTGLDRWALKSEIHDLPKRGAPKLLAACRDDADDLRRGGSIVVAVFDDDKIREALALPSDACKAEIIRTIGQDVQIVLLESNTESVVRSAGNHCLCAADLLDLALDRKDLNARDRVLNKAAAAQRSVRESVLADVPSLRRLVDALVKLYEPA